MTNRLANATSPYLLQHAENPVEWWEWSPEAFEEARRRQVPVLLSVGYAACHWCHVMAHESFEDAETAAYMNAHFVNVKVDREERPDVDAVYMQATTSMTGHGGWPMTVVLDHEGNPFFAGTYFPNRPRGGQPAFTQVLQALVEAWEQRPDDVRRVAGTVREHLSQRAAISSEPVDRSILDDAVATFAREFDSTAGGWGSAPKFPPSMVLEFLRVRAAGGARAADMLAATCEAMARGGMYDQLGGGFARYSVDRDWVVPHFEKMLYDNAQLIGLYARWGTPLGERIAAESADFLLRELRTPEGGFASALDADSLDASGHAVEGAFYAWTPQQLLEALGPDDAAWAAQVFEVTAAGTFEHGASTLQLREDPEGPGAQRLVDVRSRLLAAREHRARPALDDKIVAAWNGLAISALCDTARLLGRPDHLAAALAAGRLLRSVHLDGARLVRVSRDGQAGPHAGVLEDYGCVAGGFLSLAAATGEASWLDDARALLDHALEAFAAGDGGYFDTASDAEALVTRPRDPSDNASPSGLSALAHSLLLAHALTGEGRYRDAAEAALATAVPVMRQAPRFAGWSLVAAALADAGPLEVAIIGPDDDHRAALVRTALRRPGTVVVAAESASGIPLLEGRTATAGRATAYVCRGFVCERPVTELADLVALLGG